MRCSGGAKQKSRATGPAAHAADPVRARSLPVRAGVQSSARLLPPFAQPGLQLVGRNVPKTGLGIAGLIVRLQRPPEPIFNPSEDISGSARHTGQRHLRIVDRHPVRQVVDQIAMGLDQQRNAKFLTLERQVLRAQSQILAQGAAGIAVRDSQAKPQAVQIGRQPLLSFSACVGVGDGPSKATSALARPIHSRNAARLFFCSDRLCADPGQRQFPAIRSSGRTGRIIDDDRPKGRDRSNSDAEPRAEAPGRAALRCRRRGSRAM